MQNNTVTLSRQDLNKILESLNNIQAAIIVLQISSNKEDQDIFKDITDNIYGIRLCLPDNSPY